LIIFGFVELERTFILYLFIISLNDYIFIFIFFKTIHQPFVMITCSLRNQKICELDMFSFVTGEARQVPKVVCHLILISDYISRLIWRLINAET
jgi:hypothetical protein